MGQRRGIALILAAAAACLLLAAVGAYSLYAILDADAFADRATSTLHSDEVREELASRMAARVIEQQPQLARGEDAIKEAATAQVTTDASFEPGFHAAALGVDRALLSDADADARLRVAGSGAALQERLEQLPNWQSLDSIDDPLLVSFESTGRSGRLRTLIPPAHAAAVPLTIAFALGGLVLLALGFARAADRRRGVWAAGITIAAAAGLLAAGLTGVCDVVLNQFDTGFGDAVVVQIFDAFLGDLRAWALAIAAAGLVVAAAADAPRRLSLRALLATPTWGGDRLVRAGGLLAIAVLAVTLPDLVLDIGLVTLAGGLVYVAAAELVRVLAPPDCSRRVARAVVTAGSLLVLIAVVVVPATASMSPS
jgi:hypothetical protein